MTPIGFTNHVSNLEKDATELDVRGGPAAADSPVFERITGREVVLTPRRFADDVGSTLEQDLTVRRYLPGAHRRMVGAWCFLDYYGPTVIREGVGMQVPPHPHCGLQTISWLVSGEIRHTDSVGSEATVRPGQLALMTAGQGIAHAERSPGTRPPILHGAQLWVALPDAVRDAQPSFEHLLEPPKLEVDGATVTLILGSLEGTAVPARVYSPLVGADIDLPGNGRSTLALTADWEHAILVMRGSVRIGSQLLGIGEMAYLGCGRTELQLESELGARVLLIGGAPFTEELLMWWNFVARSHEEIVAARQDWTSGVRFGTVEDSSGRLPAPPIPPVRLKPRGRSI